MANLFEVSLPLTMRRSPKGIYAASLSEVALQVNGKPLRGVASPHNEAVPQR
jgi:hypothetical protein